MKSFVDSVKLALKEKNWYAALFISLTLPDVCGKIENPDEKTQTRYINWFEEYMKEYADFLSGNDCYALRCSLLHEGTDNITAQKCKEVLEHFIFMTGGPHLTLFRDCIINGKKESLLQLRVDKFCEDICEGVEAWVKKSSSNSEVAKRLNETIKIHEPGFNYGGIKFG